AGAEAPLERPAPPLGDRVRQVEGEAALLGPRRDRPPDVDEEQREERDDVERGSDRRDGDEVDRAALPEVRGGFAEEVAERAADRHRRCLLSWRPPPPPPCLPTEETPA